MLRFLSLKTLWPSDSPGSVRYLYPKDEKWNWGATRRPQEFEFHPDDDQDDSNPESEKKDQ